MSLIISSVHEVLERANVLGGSSLLWISDKIMKIKTRSGRLVTLWTKLFKLYSQNDYQIFISRRLRILYTKEVSIEV